MLRKYLDIFVIVYLNNILIYSQTEEEHKLYVTAGRNVRRSNCSDEDEVVRQQGITEC